MSKQVLSVADFALIVALLNKEIRYIEESICFKYGGIEKGFLKKPASISDENVKKHLLSDQRYIDLIHLKQSLQNLNIEVETPDVEITQKDKGE